MLEECLQSNNFSPTESSQGMLSFVRYELQDGGANAEKRFIALFPLLCDRLFGSLSKDKEGEFRHEAGGWLAWDKPWVDRVSNSSIQSNSLRVFDNSNRNSSPPSSSLRNNPVVQLLCGIEGMDETKDRLPTLLEALSGNTETRRGARIQYPFQALPRQTQDSVMSFFMTSTESSFNTPSSKTNAAHLFGDLLCVTLEDQSDLKRYFQKRYNKSPFTDRRNRQPLSLCPYGGISSTLMLSESTSEFVPNKKEKVQTHQIMLTMVEYFLFTFIRFPLTLPVQPPTLSQNRRNQSPGTKTSRSISYGESIYNFLFRCYLSHYLPYPRHYKHNSSYTSNLFQGFKSLSLENELFLRIVIELWLVGDLKMQSTSSSIMLFRERCEKMTPSLTSEISFKYLKFAYDLVKITSKYNPPSTSITVQKGLKNLIIHALKDLLLAQVVYECHEVTKMIGSRDINDNGTIGAKTSPWCISPLLTILQPHMYCHILMAFRYAPIHVPGSIFHAALDLWLLWLEPWNVETCTSNSANAFSQAISQMSHRTSSREIQTRLKTKKPNSLSKYKAEWEPYIAANLYFYTVPLALFLRRARELDFSSHSFAHSSDLVQRVFRVYTAEVLGAIHNALGRNSSNPMISLVKLHGENLGEYSPCNDENINITHSMLDLRSDMQNLLEEIYTQHNKASYEGSFMNQIGANIINLFSALGLSTSTQEKGYKLRLLVTKAQQISELPSDLKFTKRIVNQSFKKTSNDSDPIAYQDANGILTEYGKSKLINGKYKLRPSDIAACPVFSNDGLQLAATAYEISWLVTLTNNLSNHLNAKVGMPLMNFRFFADYRNLAVIFFSICVWVKF